MAKILIAEDEISIRELLKAALSKQGHDIITTEDGSLALDMLEEHQGEFDLLLSDIKMPVMDGIALSLQVAKSWPGLTILLMTGYANQRERAYGLEDLVYDVINKPFTLKELRDKVQDALDNVPVEIESLAAQYR